jgi:hypothetical protein
MGRGGGRGRVVASAAVDESSEGQGGGDEGEGGVGGPGQDAGLGVRRSWCGERAWARGDERRGCWASLARCRSQDGWSGRLGVAQEREWIDVAAAVAGAARSEAQATRRAQRTEALAGREVRAAADVEAAEAQVGGDERAAADGDREALVRERAGEGHLAGARGLDARAGRSRDVDASPLAPGERSVRGEPEVADDAAVERPAPGGVRRGAARRARRAPRARRTRRSLRPRVRRRAGPLAWRRPPRRDEERDDEAGDRQGDEDEGVGAWGHAPTVGAPWRGAGGWA